MLALISNTLSNLFAGGIDVNSITGGATGLDIVVQEAIRNVLGVIGGDQLVSSFLRGSSRGSGGSGGSGNGLEQISAFFSGQLRALGMANVEGTLRGLVSLKSVGNNLINSGRAQDGQTLLGIASLLDFTASDPGFNFRNVKKLVKVGRRIKRIARRTRLRLLLQESGEGNSATVLTKLASLSDLENLLNIRIIIAPVIRQKYVRSVFHFSSYQ